VTVIVIGTVGMFAVCNYIHQNEYGRLKNTGEQLKDVGRFHMDEADKAYRMGNTQVADKHLTQAHKAFDRSRATFEKVISMQPISDFANTGAYFIGIDYYLEHKPEECIKAFERLIRNYPNSHYIPRAYYHIGLSYNHLSAQESDLEKKKELLDKAIENMKTLLYKYPNDQFATFARDWLTQHILTLAK
jgi:outer membrane protein assembly factor BamD (BamD/ComL family)